MAQCGAGEHEQWQGYITVLVINHAIIESISILSTAVICLTMKFDEDKLQDCFRQEVKCTLALC